MVLNKNKIFFANTFFYKLSVFVLFFCFSANAQALILKAYSKGYSNLKNPRVNFMSPLDIEFIKTGSMPLKENAADKKTDDYEIFLQNISIEDYALAQKVALKNKENPLFILNLSLLYFYLAENNSAKTALNIWLRNSSEIEQFRFLHAIMAKKINSYLYFCGNEIKKKELKYYAYFLSAYAGDLRSYENKILKKWETTILSKEITAEEKKNHRKYYAAARFMRAVKNQSNKEIIKWLYHLDNTINVLDLKPVIAGNILIEAGKEKDALKLWEKEFNSYSQKNIKLKDFYSRYLLLLVSQKKWNEIQNILQKLPADSAVDKAKTLSFTNRQKTKKTDEFTIKAKVKKKK
ncbi:MAG: hypothetical protein OEZ13_00995 [Spirochaetia bacterium]|nr:hypothetical protein [Spirochaetia bacterium]